MVEQANLDWYRNKVINPQKRGNVSLVPVSQYALNKAAKTKVRCIWPSYMETNESRFMSRRVWGRQVSL